jgi:hypothetical protein
MQRGETSQYTAETPIATGTASLFLLFLPEIISGR